MKLRNKLIPLISLAATAAAVAPVASCGNVSLDESTNMVDVLHGYLPDIARADASGTLTAEQAKDLYIDHAKKNTDIIAQDLYWWESIAVKYRLYNAALGSGKSSFLYELNKLYGLVPITETISDSFDIVPTVAKFGVSDISIQDNKLVNPNTLEEETIYSISMKFNYEYKFEINADVANGTTRYAAQRSVDVSLTSEYKNIPITVIWDTEYGCWRVMVTGWYGVYGNEKTDTSWITQKMENWSFNFDYKSIVTDTIKNYEGGTDVYTYDGSKGGLIDSYAKLINWLPEDSDEYESAIRGIVINFGSYHMYDVLGPKWSYGNLGLWNNVKGPKATGNYQLTGIMHYALSRNWTWAEYYSENYPSTKGEWTLNSVTTEAGKDTFDLVLNGDEPTTVGTVKLESKLYNDGWYDDTSINIGLYFTITITDDELKKVYDLDHNTIIRMIQAQALTFTIPENTKLSIHVYHGVDDEGTAVYVDEEFTTELDINCFWTAADKKK